MKILFYFGHPAQYLFLRATIKNLIENEHDVIILIKTKDVLEKLLQSDNLSYKNILIQARGDYKLSIIWSFFKRLFIIFPVLQKEKPSLLVGEDATLAILGRVLRINRICITEDDYEVIKNLAQLAYPNTQTILTPDICDVSKYRDKKIGYAGYMKLGYLHPKVFSPNPLVFDKYDLPDQLVLIRVAKLTAFHDDGAEGISFRLLHKLITLVKSFKYSVRISSEKSLPSELEQYLLKINPSDMHHVLSKTILLISDSQSMSVEAAMLGTPSIRFSSFTGKISVLEELEHKYDLTYGIDPSSPELLLNKTEALLKQHTLKSIFKERSKEMLKDKIDVTSFITWFIENYPESARVMRKDPDYQYRFK